jgi:hypothetical protein
VNKSLSFIQISLQHSFRAVVQLQQTLAERKPDVALLQKPYVKSSERFLLFQEIMVVFKN